MVVELGVIVDVDARALPLAVLVALAGQRPQRGLVDFLVKTLARAFAFAEAALVEPREQFADGLIGLAEREEFALAQSRQNPALDDRMRQSNYMVDADNGWSYRLRAQAAGVSSAMLRMERLARPGKTAVR